MDKKVIVVGAGVGGLATAIRLLHNGYKVVIYEKNETIGGRVNIIDTENFRFDLSASILMMPEAYKEIFSCADKNYADYLEFIEIDPTYRLFSYDKTVIDFSNKLSSLTKNLENFSKEDSLGYFKFIADVYDKYLISDRYFLKKSQDNFKDFFNLETLMKAIDLHTLSTSYNYISKYITNEKLRDYLAFQTMYVGISPFNGPNIYTLIPVVSQIYGLWHLKGGMYSFINALEKLIYELGGTIKTSMPVEEIIFSNNKAIGVKTLRGIEKSDIVVCNADFPYAVKNLIKDKHYKDEYTDEKLAEMNYTCSTFIMNLGLKKEIPELAVHNIYLGKNFKEGIEAAFTGALPENPSLYIYCPSRIDRSMIKNGGECLNLMVRVPNLLFKEISWNNTDMELLANKILKELENILGLEHIKENILYKNYVSPLDMERRFNAYAGTAFGLSPTLTQTNYFRPHYKLNTADNLYFVGNSVHPGPGISLVLNSSKIVAEEILSSKFH